MQTALRSFIVVILAFPLLILTARDVLAPKEAPPATGGTTLSEAVEVGDATFQLDAQHSWVIPEKEASTDVKFTLVVTNKSNGPIQINVFDTLSFTLLDGAGKKINFGRGRDATHVPPPVQIEKGATAKIERPAKLEKSATPGAYKLTGSDGAGGWWWFDGLNAGNYTITMTCTNTQQTWQHLRDTPAKNNIADTPLWTGSATTKAIIIDINKKIPSPP